MKRIVGVIIGLLLLAGIASGQTVQQSGTVTAGHAAKWVTKGVIGDSGTAANGALTSLGVTASGPGICQNSGPITGAYNQLCLGVSTSSNAIISLAAFGGATPQNLVFNINGHIYTIPSTFGLTVGTTTIASGGGSGPLYDNNGVLGEGTRSGNTTVFGTTSGTLNTSHCVTIDSSGNLIDAGGPCTTGGGGGTVAPGTSGQQAMYSGTPITVSGYKPFVIDPTYPPYNAVCNGPTATSNDTAAIQQAINDAQMVSSNTNGPVAIVRISKLCNINDTITIRHSPTSGGNAIIQCTGSSGFQWTGGSGKPMLTFGDATNVVLDQGFQLLNCEVYGSSIHASANADKCVLLANVQDATIKDNSIINCNDTLYNTGQCLLCVVSNNFFQTSAAPGGATAVTWSTNNGTIMQGNRFDRCGTYCIYSPVDAGMWINANYFEGTLSTTVASIYINLGGGTRITNNTYEDDVVGINPDYTSIWLNSTNSATVADEYWASALSSNYAIRLGNGGSNAVAVEFRGLGNLPGVASGKYVRNDDAGGQKIWFGGKSCSAAKIWGGSAGGTTAISAFPCGIPTISGSGFGADSYFNLDAFGTVTNNDTIASGLAPQVTGVGGDCSGHVTSVTGGGNSGEIQTTAVACTGTFVLSWASGTRVTAPHGRNCQITDRNTPANLWPQIATTTTTVTISGTTVASDVLGYLCSPY